MLAERKRKQRIVADPQNVTWKEDESKFGMKMLKKMGWEEGQGLGKNLDGCKSHVKVQLRKDAIGLGVTKKTAAEETYYQLTSFEAVLARAQLNQEEKTELIEKQKIKKGKKARKREEIKTEEKTKLIDRHAHRRKFIRNKAVSQYSEQQLREILGPTALD